MQGNILLNELIYPIRIPTPFAVGDVYSYLIDDEKKVLVDCGHKAGEPYELVKNQLGKRNLSVRDIDEIWLTHGHPDHYGQAGRLAEESGAVVYGHAKERANFAGNNDGELFDIFFKKHSIPQEQRSLMIEQLDWLQQFQLPLSPEWIEDGDALSSGALSFVAKHTPGHAPGHLTFSSDQGVIFGGDILLEHISTNALINFDPDTRARNKSLLQYRNSLEWIRLQKGLVLPGHGKFIGNIKQVSDHHLNDHLQRYGGIRKLLEEKPRTLYELAQAIFPEPMQKGAVFLVLSEVMGYLDWGIEEGIIECEEEVFKIKEPDT